MKQTDFGVQMTSFFTMYLPTRGVFQTLCGRAGTGGNNTPLVAEPVTLKIRCGGGNGGKGNDD